MNTTSPSQQRLISQSLPAVNQTHSHAEKHYSLDFYSESPPPYEEAISIERPSSRDTRKKNKHLYPLKELRKINNQGLLEEYKRYKKGERHLTPEYQARDVASSSGSASLTPKIIIDQLIREEDYRIPLYSLKQNLNEDSNVLLQFIGSYPSIFALHCDSFGEEDSLSVDLSPQVEICKKHVSSKCKDTCKKIHMCIDYIKGNCQNELDCVYEHDAMSDHNCIILSSYYLEEIENYHLLKILSRILKVTFPPLCCSAYNRYACNRDFECFDLHICKTYVVNLGECPAGDLCVLNHNIYDDQCNKIFSNVGVVSSQGKEIDILQMVAENTVKYTRNRGVRHDQDVTKVEQEITELNFEEKAPQDSSTSSDSENDDGDDPKSELDQGAAKWDGDTFYPCVSQGFGDPYGVQDETGIATGTPGSAVGAVGGQEQMGVVVWRGKKRYSHKRDNFVKSERRKQSRQIRYEIKNQRKIEKMERKVVKMQSKIDYMKNKNQKRDSEKPLP